MYSPQLETFLQVARLGSFSKAARALYITPSAVIQQVNHLEEQLQAKLLVRTSHGVSLTPAGKLVYQEGLDIVQRSKALQTKLAALTQKEELVIGTQFLSQPQLFPSLWAEYWGSRTPVPTRFVMLEKPWEEETDVCIMEAVMFGDKPLPGFQVLPLCNVPICLAVPPEHPLANRSCLTYADLYTAPVVTIRTEYMCQQLKQLRADLMGRGIQVIEADRYTPALFNMCRVNGYFLQIPACWDTLCFGMKVLPCAWDYKLPYGFFWRPDRVPAGAKGFMEDLQEKAKSGSLRWKEKFAGLPAGK